MEKIVAAQIFGKEFHKIDQLVRQFLLSEDNDFGEIASYIIDLDVDQRPSVVFYLTAKAIDNQSDLIFPLAAIIDLVYTAIVLHDSGTSDKELESKVICDTLGARILLGDYLFSKAFHMMVKTNQISVVQRFAFAIAMHTEGQVIQLSEHERSSSVQDDLNSTIYSSRATLFYETITDLAFIMTTGTARENKALTEFGRHFGVAAQISRSRSKPPQPGQRINQTANTASGAIKDAMSCLSILPASFYKDKLYDLAARLQSD
jgi:octaprenyl-diphosphate synthase